MRHRWRKSSSSDIFWLGKEYFRRYRENLEGGIEDRQGPQNILKNHDLEQDADANKIISRQN